MKLVIGGAWQGKIDAACNYFKIEKTQLIDGRDCPMESIYDADGIHHFHEYVKRMLMQQISTEGFLDRLCEKNPNLLIISNEIGYGLVPMEPFEREWREQTGRICCEAAQKSDQVLRVTAGIVNLIKGMKE